MTHELFIVVVDLGGCTAPMLVPYADIRCPSTGADVDHLAIDPGRGLKPVNPEDDAPADAA